MVRDGFEELVEGHRPALQSYARAVCRDRWLADDVVQETMLRAWRYRDTFVGLGSIEGWLLRICHNCIVDAVNVRERAVHELEPHHHPVEPADLSGELVLLLHDLPAHQREVIALCGVLGYDYQSAADILAVPVGTIRSRLARGRAAMADALDEQRRFTA